MLENNIFVSLFWLYISTNGFYICKISGIVVGPDMRISLPINYSFDNNFADQMDQIKPDNGRQGA
jgi:hypothetical protein